jgi:hypothetical protein
MSNPALDIKVERTGNKDDIDSVKPTLTINFGSSS